MQVKALVGATLACVLATCAAGAQAAPLGGHPLSTEGVEMHLDRRTKWLDLTDAQRADMQAIMQDKRTNPDLPRTALHKRIAAVLAGAQRERLAQMGDRHRPGRDSGR